MEGGYDIHRHDILYRFGWPLVCFERYDVHWWAYRKGGVGPVSDADKRQWIAERPAGGADKEEIARWTAHPFESKVIAPRAVWITIVANATLLFTGWIVVLGLAIWIWIHLADAWKRLRNREGLCTHCGYDLRASRQFGRCPECGTPCDPGGSLTCDSDRRSVQ
ncbi:MAG: hypothetical protein JXB13_05580 [Phycisphaerae bacterium]|nr:hypothetical protein [Phycisphaerae bacterium]